MLEKSHETKEHADRLTAYTTAVGRKLALDDGQLYELQMLSSLHDIGKIGVNDHILTNPNKPMGDEWLALKKHPEIGYRIALVSPELSPIAEYILSHHERWDGMGYPRNLRGEEIPLLSRILSVADAYDAMVNDRVYRKAMTKEQALEELEKHAGTQFDPEIVRVFHEVI